MEPPIITMEEVHRRILFLELKLILLDNARYGAELPDVWREKTRNLRDDEIYFLILAKFFEDLETQEGREMAELIRLHIELMDLTPVNYLSSQSPLYQENIQTHPWYQDTLNAPNNWGNRETRNKLDRRWELTETLYGKRTIKKVLYHRINYRELVSRMGTRDANRYAKQQLQEAGINTDLPYQAKHYLEDDIYEFTQEATPKLGRSTRTLTDTVRWAFLNAGLDGGPGGGCTALFQTHTPVGEAKILYAKLLSTLLDSPSGSFKGSPWDQITFQDHFHQRFSGASTLYENEIYFDDKLNHYNFTFTDHNYQPQNTNGKINFTTQVSDGVDTGVREE